MSPQCACGLTHIKRQWVPSMQRSLPELLFPEYRRRVLSLLLLRPDEALHGREIARRTGLPAGTVTRLSAQNLQLQRRSDGQHSTRPPRAKTTTA